MCNNYISWEIKLLSYSYLICLCVLYVHASVCTYAWGYWFWMSSSITFYLIVVYYTYFVCFCIWEGKVEGVHVLQCTGGPRTTCRNWVSPPRGAWDSSESHKRGGAFICQAISLVHLPYILKQTPPRTWSASTCLFFQTEIRIQLSTRWRDLSSGLHAFVG